MHRALRSTLSWLVLGCHICASRLRGSSTGQKDLQSVHEEANSSTQRELEAGVVAYLNVDKSGSSVLRYMFAKHNTRCMANQAQWSQYSAEGHYTSHICHIAGSAKSLGDCADVGGTGSVIQANHYGICATLRENRMPCRYVFMMRDPVDRLLSAWSYFCRGCTEQRLCMKEREATARKVKSMGLDKTASWKPPILRGIPKDADDWGKIYGPRGEHQQEEIRRCPSMSVLDFARAEGNVYVNALTTNRDVKNDPGISQRLKKAKARLLQDGMFVMILEDLSPAKSTMWKTFGQFFGCGDLDGKQSRKAYNSSTTNLNTSHRSSESSARRGPNETERRELERILEIDYILYNTTRTRLRREAKSREREGKTRRQMLTTTRNKGNAWKDR